MDENIQKFLFLGVMILVVVFSGRSLVHGPTAKTAPLGAVALARLEPPPLFVLAPPDVARPAEQPANQTFIESDEVVATPRFYRHGDDPPPEIAARAALVGDLLSGEVFWGSNTEERWLLASITKLMTAAVVSRNMPLNQSTTIIESDFRAESSEQNASSGSRFTVGDFMRAMLLASSNESAEAAARIYGRDNFLAKMNANAREWGLNDTFFDDPTGLSASNQSTAADLLKLSGYLYNRYPEIFKITRKPSVFIADLNSGKNILIKNINNFAGRADFLGGKTGYTDEASGNLLSIFSYKERPITIIVLGTEDRFGDMEKLLNWFESNYK